MLSDSIWWKHIGGKGRKEYFDAEGKKCKGSEVGAQYLLNGAREEEKIRILSQVHEQPDCVCFRGHQNIFWLTQNELGIEEAQDLA